MRHRKRGRRLGRSSSHRKAMFKNLASSLILTERETDELDDNAPKIKGRVVMTLHKAKEVRSLVEKVITLARKAQEAQRAADKLAIDAKRDSAEWKAWRKSDKWQQWATATAPVLNARRRAIQMLGDKEAVKILFDVLGPRYEDRPGGYTRILKLATPRLGDAGARAILEFVGVHDREIVKSEKPAFAKSDAPAEEEAVEEEAEEDKTEEASAEETSSEEDTSEEK